MSNFKKDYDAVFTHVCFWLGNDWRIDKRDTACEDRIVMINPDLRGYQIVARAVKNRLFLVGFCRKGNSTSECISCTASLKRAPKDLARHIEKTLLSEAMKQCAGVEEMLQKIKADKERKFLLLHLLSKTATVTPYQSYYNHICEIKTKNIKAELLERSNELYELKLVDLSFEQLLKLVGQLATVN